MAGQYFDIRLEVHAPKNGSEAIGLPPDDNFTFEIARGDGAAKPAADFFGIQEPKLENWTFSWYEGRPSLDLFMFRKLINLRPVRQG